MTCPSVKYLTFLFLRFLSWTGCLPFLLPCGTAERRGSDGALCKLSAPHESHREMIRQLGGHLALLDKCEVAILDNSFCPMDLHFLLEGHSKFKS